MGTLEEIEAAVSRLAPSDYEKFRQWLTDYDNRVWDKEMEEDAKEGRLDGLVNEALDDLKNERCIEL